MDWLKYIPYFQVYETYTIFVTPLDSFHLNVPEQQGRNIRFVFYFLVAIILAALAGGVYIALWSIHDCLWKRDSEEEADKGAVAQAKRFEAAVDAIKDKLE